MATRDTPYPQLWRTICARVGLAPSASVDVVRAAYGDAVGRGSIQRIQEGVQPRMATIAALAEHVGMQVADFLRDEQPLPPPPGFKDRMQVSESDWQLLQDIKSGALDEEIEVIRRRARELERRVQAKLAELHDQPPPREK